MNNELNNEVKLQILKDEVFASLISLFSSPEELKLYLEEKEEFLNLNSKIK